MTARPPSQCESQVCTRHLVPASVNAAIFVRRPANYSSSTPKRDIANARGWYSPRCPKRRRFCFSEGPSPFGDYRSADSHRVFSCRRDRGDSSGRPWIGAETHVPKAARHRTHNHRRVSVKWIPAVVVLFAGVVALDGPEKIGFGIPDFVF
jgi:hypothetical protein